MRSGVQVPLSLLLNINNLGTHCECLNSLNAVVPLGRQRTTDEISEQLRGKKVVSFENRYLCKDGSYKWMAWEGTEADKN